MFKNSDDEIIAKMPKKAIFEILRFHYFKISSPDSLRVKYKIILEIFSASWASRNPI